MPDAGISALSGQVEGRKGQDDEVKIVVGMAESANGRVPMVKTTFLGLAGEDRRYCGDVMIV